MIFFSFVVDPDDDEITLFFDAVRNFEIKGRKPAHMLAELFPVQIDRGGVIARSKMKKQPFIWRLYVVEIPLVPDAAFVKQKRLALSVPVPGHMKLARSSEIIFNKFRLGLRFVVLKECSVILQRLATVVEGPNVVWIHDHLPLTIQAGGLPRVNIRDQRRNLRCDASGEEH